MDKSIFERLKAITEEEKSLLNKNANIDWSIYMQEMGNTINAQKLLSAGKLITIRPHTRFVHFPEHTHDYVEVVYMCEGVTEHIVNGRSLILKKGELLFLSQNATHEVCRAEERDVAVNFIVLPDFFTGVLAELGEEETPLRRFLVDCLCGNQVGSGYLHFEIANIKPLQNLVENLLWILMDDVPNRRRLSQMTMSLLFLQLVGYTETLQNDMQEDVAVLKALQYIEANYASCSLESLAEQLHYSVPWISREIKNKTGNTFTQLVQEKRLSQAAFLLKHTERNVADISLAVGYENISYFHRLFSFRYGKSPRSYRMQERTLF